VSDIAPFQNEHCIYTNNNSSPGAIRYAVSATDINPYLVVVDGIGRTDLVLPDVTTIMEGMAYQIQNNSPHTIRILKDVVSFTGTAICVCEIPTMESGKLVLVDAKGSPNSREGMWHAEATHSAPEQILQMLKASVEAYGFDTSKMNHRQLIDFLLELAFVKPTQGHG
jgi:hypothetical protein